MLETVPLGSIDMIILFLALRFRRRGFFELLSLRISGVRRWSRHRIRCAVFQYFRRINWDPARIYPLWLGPRRWLHLSLIDYLCEYRQVGYFWIMNLHKERGLLVCVSYQHGSVRAFL